MAPPVPLTDALGVVHGDVVAPDPRQSATAKLVGSGAARGGAGGTGTFWFWFWMTRLRLQHSRRWTLKITDSGPPQDGLLGPAMVGRSGQPLEAPCATGGRHLPNFDGGGGSALGVGWELLVRARWTRARLAQWLSALVMLGSVRWMPVGHKGVHEVPPLHALPQHV